MIARWRLPALPRCERRNNLSRMRRAKCAEYERQTRENAFPARFAVAVLRRSGSRFGHSFSLQFSSFQAKRPLNLDENNLISCEI